MVGLIISNKDKYGIKIDEYFEEDIFEYKGRYFYSLRLVEKILGISDMTRQRWYRWFKDQDQETRQKYPLPIIYKFYFRKSRLRKYILYEDIDKLKEFQKNIHTGLLAHFNRMYCWGTRGKRIRKKYGSKSSKEVFREMAYEKLPKLKDKTKE